MISIGTDNLKTSQENPEKFSGRGVCFDHDGLLSQFLWPCSCAPWIIARTATFSSFMAPGSIGHRVFTSQRTHAAPGRKISAWSSWRFSTCAADDRQSHDTPHGDLPSPKLLVGSNWTCGIAAQDMTRDVQDYYERWCSQITLKAPTSAPHWHRKKYVIFAIRHLLEQSRKRAHVCGTARKFSDDFGLMEALKNWPYLERKSWAQTGYPKIASILAKLNIHPKVDNTSQHIQDDGVDVSENKFFSWESCYLGQLHLEIEWCDDIDVSQKFARVSYLNQQKAASLLNPGHLNQGRRSKVFRSLASLELKPWLCYGSNATQLWACVDINKPIDGTSHFDIPPQSWLLCISFPQPMSGRLIKCV